MPDTTTNTPPDLAARQRAEQAIGSSDVRHVYFNEFLNMAGATDFASVLAVNSRHVCVLHMSVAVAKSFAVQLLTLVNQYENKLKHQVLTLEDVQQRLQADTVKTETN